MSHSSSLPTPASFPAFPFEPYQIQQGFMQELYRCLEDGCVGLLESPTGTGKTMSIICSSIQWLIDDRKRKEKDEREAHEKEKEKKRNLPTSNTDDDLPDWLMQPQVSSEVSKQRAGTASDRSAVARSRFKSGQVSSHHSRPKPSFNTLGGSKLKPDIKQGAVLKDGLDEFTLSDKENEGEGDKSMGGKRKRQREDSSDDEGGVASTAAAKIDFVPKPYKTQILFCSRTHSQLSQFVGELKRTSLTDQISIIALAGRKVLCINEEVIKAGPATLLNERCLEMQQAKKPTKEPGGKTKAKAASKCPHLLPMNQGKDGEGSEVWEGFVDSALGQALDVEDLLNLGMSRGVCPYYGARKMLEEADLVMLPYASLLSQEARESLGISLEGSVVIFDESHNLVDAVNSAHSFSVSLSQLRGAGRQVRMYFERFSEKLNPNNAQKVQTLLRVVETLTKYLSCPEASHPRGAAGSASVLNGEAEGSVGRVMTANDFLFDLSLDSINLVTLLHWVKESKMLQKCAGYAQTQEVSLDPGGKGDHHPGGGSRAERLSSLHAATSFLSALTNPDSDGRVVVQRAHESSPSELKGSLKYLLLNAAAHFSRVLLKARSVILASGTLSPIQGLLQQLFPTHRLIHSTSNPPLPSIKSIPTLQPIANIARHYECQHVIPTSSLIANIISKGPSGLQLSLTHSERSKPQVMDEIGRILINLCNIVPDGLIAFLPSFSQMDALISRWKSTGAILTMGAKKKVFSEPRSATEIDAILADYGSTIRNCKARNLTGALLLSVVGAKLSEGINFGDALGRGVVVIGMPYPNPYDLELRERMGYIDKAARASRQELPGPVYSAYSGQEYYEDLCMKAVNQSIGRVIRHKGDHAAVVLVDQRYQGGGARGGPVDKLPNWMKPSLDHSTEFGQIIGKLHKFFKDKL